MHASASTVALEVAKQGDSIFVSTDLREIRAGAILAPNLAALFALSHLWHSMTHER